MSRFNAEFYQRYRPLYPGEVFDGLFQFLSQVDHSLPVTVADVGCGTGQSTLSLLEAGAALCGAYRLPDQMIAIDPDPLMLEKAQSLNRLRDANVAFLLGSGEEIPMQNGSLDAIVVGSAFHWMDAQRASQEFLRVLRPRGLILICEYQFPKCIKLPEPGLNEWIRREFNLRWKAPGQKPRGNFAQVTRCFRMDPRLRTTGDRNVPMILDLQADEL